MTPTARFRLRITRGDAIAIGPGKIALLEAVADTGSISAAARSLRMSYRRAWLLLDEMNRSLTSPVVDTATGGARGGGARLTETGRRVIALYREIDWLAQQAAAGPLAELSALVKLDPSD